MNLPASDRHGAPAAAAMHPFLLLPDTPLKTAAAESIGRGLLVFDADARVLSCNTVARRALRADVSLGLVPMSGGPGTAMRLQAQNARLQASIEQAVLDCAAEHDTDTNDPTIGSAGGRPAHTLLLTAQARRPGLVLHLSRLPTASDERARGGHWPAVLGTLLDCRRRPVLDTHLLGDLFDMSAAASRVAEAYLRVDSVKDAARLLGISANTVKTHLATVYEKTGCTRQSQLVRLLMTLAETGPD
jgi:DNA-binding CsgD family transcriptional regulator